jgi:hypothetical protein
VALLKFFGGREGGFRRQVQSMIEPDAMKERDNNIRRRKYKTVEIKRQFFYSYHVQGWLGLSGQRNQKENDMMNFDIDCDSEERRKKTKK